MDNFVFIYVLLSILDVTFSDHHRPGNYLNHDRTVVNCAKFKREVNQHSCVLSPFNTEGPYFLSSDLLRSDITDGQVGLPLKLTIKLINSNDCNPLENMYVHVWQSNALGVYSGVELFPKSLPIIGPEGPFGPNGPGGFGQLNNGGPGDNGMADLGRPASINNERFGRGYQISDSNGQVTFETIVPGWYTGRCLHMHVEVFHKNTTEKNEITYVGQIFFDPKLTDQLKLVNSYSSNNQPLTLNEDDWVYKNHGNETLLNLIDNGNSFSGSITFGINPDLIS
ncbi:uncharacterized protein LOC128397098 [Panonychus citri]|uniref:uncharacterized protein LOC128397098 n=1 Tax=Panonychus citri TaxID=50023 RepID=UPI002307932C|nr:uncharacterized protein LOC128397098 [Panonychus citri]